MISRLFALLYMWTILLTSCASPLPAGMEGIRASQYYRRAHDTVVVDLTVAIFDRGTDVEHWGLVLGDKFLHGKNEFVNKKLKETLTPNVQDWNLYNSSPRVTKIPLGQARFNHRSDKESAVNDALALQMPAPYMEKGGGCMDFITLVLDQLKRKNQCGEDVVKKYREEYVANYHEVSKLVWDVDIQP